MSTASRRVYVFAGFTLDVQGRQLDAPNGVEIRLTKQEFSLLCGLLERPRQVLSRDTLLDATRGAEARVLTELSMCRSVACAANCRPAQIGSSSSLTAGPAIFLTPP